MACANALLIYVSVIGFIAGLTASFLTRDPIYLLISCAGLFLGLVAFVDIAFFEDYSDGE